MSTMNPTLRLRRAFRSMGAEDDRANEAADPIDHTYGCREWDLFHVQGLFTEADISPQLPSLPRLPRLPRQSRHDVP